MREEPTHEKQLHFFNDKFKHLSRLGRKSTATVDNVWMTTSNLENSAAANAM